MNRNTKPEYCATEAYRHVSERGVKLQVQNDDGEHPESIMPFFVAVVDPPHNCPVDSIMEILPEEVWL